MELEQKGYQYIPLGISFDEATQEFFIFGEYFDSGKQFYKQMRDGFYLQTTEPGLKVKKESLSSWKEDVSKEIAMDKKGRIENKMHLMIHKMVRTADGKIFAAGEQYKKAINPWAFLPIQHDIALYKMVIGNMMVFEFDKEFKLAEVHTVDKKKKNISMQRGMGINGTPALGYWLKFTGLFDYSFTTVSADRKTFNVGYRTWDKVDGKRQRIVGNIAYSKDQKLAFDKLVVSGKPTFYTLIPAKPGYVAVGKYFRKKRTFDLSLEKLNL